MQHAIVHIKGNSGRKIGMSMSEHFTKNVTATFLFCNTCNRRTRHAVSNSRVGACLEHAPDGLSVKQRKQRAAREEEERQGDLF